MKFIGQHFQTLEHKQDRHTDATLCITTATLMAGSRAVIFLWIQSRPFAT